MTGNNQLTLRERFKRSCAYGIGCVVASTSLVLVLGFLENFVDEKSATASVIRFFLNLLGIALAPGWFLLRGMFENLRPSQLLGSALLIPLISVAIDSVIIFGVWEFFHRKRVQGLDSDSIAPQG